MYDAKVDYTEYVSDEAVEMFLDKLEAWKEANQIEAVVPDMDEVRKYMNLRYDEIRRMGAKDLVQAAFILNGYAQYLYTIQGREQAVLEWCNESIYFIVGDKIKQYGDNYVKWEQKFYPAVKENPLATELFKLRTHCLSRVKKLEKTIYPIEKMANNLEQIGRYK